MRVASKEEKEISKQVPCQVINYSTVILMAMEKQGCSDNRCIHLTIALEKVHLYPSALCLLPSPDECIP